MNHKILLTISIFLITISLFSEEIVTRKDGTNIVLLDDHTWVEVNTTELSTSDIVDKNKSFLRAGIPAADAEIIIACEMYEQGWTYTMPTPKSNKAGWGVSDGRTTWYKGWWYNSKTRLYSNTTPQKSSSGLYLGDNQNSKNSWSNGGSPRRPDVFMFLLSRSGGPRY